MVGGSAPKLKLAHDRSRHTPYAGKAPEIDACQQSGQYGLAEIVPDQPDTCRRAQPPFSFAGS